MQASAGGGISGAATRVAGPESLSPRERPENLCMERVLRERDGLGFCRSSLAGRRLNPTPELSFQYKERDRERERERDSKLSPEMVYKYRQSDLETKLTRDKKRWLPVTA